MSGKNTINYGFFKAILLTNTQSFEVEPQAETALFSGLIARTEAIVRYAEAVRFILGE
ncbi:hypothetical protein [Flavobacterium longum]|uniref:hypothetical protein n=1 Tax=Flavobacterium longum TaxID=1299340 RepID=UPI0039ED6B3D